MHSKKHLLLVGGRTGIGRSFLEKAIKNSTNLISYCGRNAVTEYCEHGRVNFIQVDLTDVSKRKEIPHLAFEKFGTIDSIVFCQRNRSEVTGIANEVDIMVTATSDIIEAAISKFKQSGNRSIVVLNSLIARFATLDNSLEYQLSRAALEQLVRYYAIKLGSQNIRINGVTTCTISKRENEYYFNHENPARMELQKNITPRSHFGTADEVTEVISFLHSKNSNFINGQTIIADGGMSIQWAENQVNL